MTGMHQCGLAEIGTDQRRIGLDVRAHDEHVTGFESRVVGEQMQQRLAQHLDLASRPMTCVNLYGAVGERRIADRRCVRGHFVAGDVGLDRSEQGPRWFGPFVVHGVIGDRADGCLQFPHVARQTRQQRVLDGQSGHIVSSSGGRRDVGECGPHRRAGVWDPDVDVAVVRERVQDVKLVGGQPSRTEHRQPGR